MADPSSPAVIHLPASWDALIIFKEIVLTGLTASDGVIYKATSDDVFDLISLLKIEGNITKGHLHQTDLNGSREIKTCENLDKNFEVSSEEEDPKLGEDVLSRSAGQNSSKRRAVHQ